MSGFNWDFLLGLVIGAATVLAVSAFRRGHTSTPSTVESQVTDAVTVVHDPFDTPAPMPVVLTALSEAPAPNTTLTIAPTLVSVPRRRGRPVTAKPTAKKKTPTKQTAKGRTRTTRARR